MTDIPVNFTLYADTEDDVDGAKEYIALYGLTYEDVRIARTKSGSIIVETKRKICLKQAQKQISAQG